MARGINKTILVGNLGADPDVKYLKNGTAVSTFSVATTETWNDHDGNRQENTQWHRISAFGKLAEICSEYLKKGSRVYIEGKIRYNDYTDKDGVKRYSTNIVLNELLMLDNKGSSGSGHQETQQEAPADSATSDKEEELPF